MLSFDRAYRVAQSSHDERDRFLAPVLETTASRLGLAAILIAHWDDTCGQLQVIGAHNMPPQPFEGAEKEHLLAVLRACFQHHPAPHVHSIGGSQLAAAVRKFCKLEAEPSQMMFVPGIARTIKLVVCGFASKEAQIAVSDETLAECEDLLDLSSLLVGATAFERRLRVMEFYVKEVGHDIASSVQATVARLSNVANEVFTGKAALGRVKEAVTEILGAYRIADTLGITADPNYNLRSAESFDIGASLKRVNELYRSEAAERHIELRTEERGELWGAWGDKKAIESAIGQILMNAIKYASGGTYITARAKEEDKSFEISVSDKGMPIDRAEEPFVWDFGFRGKNSLERHVNGSGIGLYTVRKIVAAHHGTVFVRSGEGFPTAVTVGFELPKGNLLRRLLTVIGWEYSDGP